MYSFAVQLQKYKPANALLHVGYFHDSPHTAAMKTLFYCRGCLVGLELLDGILSTRMVLTVRKDLVSFFS